MSRVAPVVPSENDLLCEQCGYTLNGLPLEGNCPECGKPIRESVGEHRKLPAWEVSHRSIRALFATTSQVLFAPTNFFRTLITRRAADDDSFFAIVNWVVASIFFAMAAVGHFLWFGGMVWPVRLDRTIIPVPFLAVAVFLILMGTNSLAARLTHWEATYRGLRLPLRVVQRGLNFHSAHYVPVAILTFITVFGFRLLPLSGVWQLHRMEIYLYTLCGEVIVFAVYLFQTYWIAMRNMMYANR
jgi:hypothetical protein